MNLLTNKFVFGIALGLAIFCASSVLAADFSVTAQSPVGIGGELNADVFLDTQNEVINAIEGKLNISDPDGALVFKNISDGSANDVSSGGQMWIQKPEFKDGQIGFSGIIPKGFAGAKKIFSVEFTARDTGSVRFSFDGLKALLNDGNGGKASVTSKNLDIVVSARQSGSVLSAAEADTMPPEPFKPLIAKSDTVFDGKFFAAYTAKDAQSGIDHYEISETNPLFFWQKKTWRICDNPCLLDNQELTSNISIKAVDRAGNERIEFVRPWTALLPYVFAALGALLVLAFFFRARANACRSKK